MAVVKIPEANRVIEGEEQVRAFLQTQGIGFRNGREIEGAVGREIGDQRRLAARTAHRRNPSSGQATEHVHEL